ncbi:MAG: hypothetical protein JSS49_06215 [Planctomycetes bacterium]|nr:hypothetical protein [Planctomycetota bacterium]
MPQKSEADQPNRSVFEFRSLIALERSVRSGILLPDYPVVKNAIPVEELTREKTIKGLLSPELGTWISIKGKWSGSDNFKASFTAWKIEKLEVNGKKFEYPSERNASATRLDLTLGDIGPFPHSGRQLRKPQEGEIWEFEAYESFHYDAMVNSEEVLSVQTFVVSYPRGPGRYTELRMREKDARRLEKNAAAN